MTGINQPALRFRFGKRTVCPPAAAHSSYSLWHPKDYWHQSGLFMLVDHDGAGSSVDSAAVFLCDPGQLVCDAMMLKNCLVTCSTATGIIIAILTMRKTSRILYYVMVRSLTNVSAGSSNLEDGQYAAWRCTTFADTYGFVLGGWNKHANLGNGGSYRRLDPVMAGRHSTSSDYII